MQRYTLGLDFGTNSVRALLVDTSNGEELATAVFDYPSGEMGVVIDASDPNVARQHPRDYLQGLEEVIGSIVNEVGAETARQIAGIGVDTTGSTPIPVNADGVALALLPEFADNPNAMAWLWKDHTAYREAAELTAAGKAMRPQYLAKCGDTYSSEWYWAKVLRCSRVDPEVWDAAATWVEHTDWIPAVLTGTTRPGEIKRGVCAAGHKAMFNPAWGGYPDAEFIGSFDGGVLNKLLESLPGETLNVSQAVGGLTADWADRLGLTEGIPVAAGAFDCHLGAIGCGATPGAMVKVIGTSTCDLAVHPLEDDIADIPGLCGIVPESVLPNHFGLEAGQSAVGDIFNWYVFKQLEGTGLTHKELDEQASQSKPGASGLLALDWSNGNRTVLVDQLLSGAIFGLTLHTSQVEIYRALVEATAFGARMIRDRIQEYGVAVDRVVNCGGIAVKSPFLLQVYADVLNCEMQISRSEETCALGSAMAAAVTAGVHPDFGTAIEKMTSIREQRYSPIAENVAIYDQLFELYKGLHDVFGTKSYAENQFHVMKDLIRIREQQRA